MRLIYKKIYFLIFFFNFLLCNILKADEVLYNGVCLNGGTFKANSTTLDGLLKNGFYLANKHNFNLTFDRNDLKYCNLVEKYLTNNPFTGEKLTNKVAMMTINFTPTPYNPNYMPQYVSVTTGGALPQRCAVYQIADLKKNNINDRFIQIIFNSSNFEHSKDSNEARKKICK